MEHTKARWRRWARPALLILLAMEVLYLVAGNYYINSGWVRALPNRRPERFLIRWGYAWTVWPGLVHLREVEMRGASRTMEWHARLGAVTAWTRILPFFERTVHLRSVSAHGLDYRQRRKPEPGEVLEAPEFLPPLPEVEAPAVKRSPARSSRKATRQPWRVLADRINARVEQIWIDRYKATGAMRVRTTLKMTVRGPMAFTGVRFTVSDGTLTYDANQVLGGLSVEAEPELPEFTPKHLRGTNPIRLLTGRYRVSAESASLFYLEPLAEKVPWLRFGGRSSLTADLDLRGGILQPGSILEADMPSVKAFFLDQSLVGRGRIQGMVERSEGRRAQIEVVLDEFALAPEGSDEPYATGKGFKVVARSREVDLDEPFATIEVTADLPEAVIPDLAWYNRYIPVGTEMEILGGQGRVEYHVEGSQEERSLHGRLILTAQDAVMRFEKYETQGDVKVAMSLRDIGVRDGRYDVSGTTIELASDKLPWQATIRLPEATMRFSNPMTAEARLDMAMTDTAPLVALFDAVKDISGFVERLMTVRDVRAAAVFRVSQKGVEIQDLEVNGEKLLVLADLSLGKEGKGGILFIKFHIFSVGLEVRDGKKDLDILRPRKWFDTQRARRRLSAQPAKAAPR